MTTVREDILDQAKRCVLRDRNLDYDEPEKNFEDIANLWNIYLQGKEVIEPHDTAVMAILIKVARIRKSPSVSDHWVDIAGYAACGAECAVEVETPSPYFVTGGASVAGFSDLAWSWQAEKSNPNPTPIQSTGYERYVWKESEDA